MMERKEAFGQGVRFQSQSKEIVKNVYDYFEKLHKKGKSSGPAKRTVEATGEQHTYILLDA